MNITEEKWRELTDYLLSFSDLDPGNKFLVQRVASETLSFLNIEIVDEDTDE